MYQGKNIRMIRKKWGLSQPAFAELLGVKGQNVSTYETDAHFPQVPTLIKLEQLTGIPIYELYTRFVLPEEVPDQPLKVYEGSTESKASEVNEFMERFKKVEDFLKSKFPEEL